MYSLNRLLDLYLTDDFFIYQMSDSELVKNILDQYVILFLIFYYFIDIYFICINE